MALSKRKTGLLESFDVTKIYNLDDAVSAIKQYATGPYAAKFNETVEIAVTLGIDARKSDQMVRGVCQLPHGTGKSVRVAVFAQGANAEAAKEAGADIVGFEDLADSIKNASQLDFDVLIATPDAMRLIGPLGRVLGPKGLMPNPKLGTVTPDVAGAVQKAKAGQVQFRAEKGGIVHCPIGKANFEPTALLENLQALMADLKRAKPSNSKGLYFRKLVLTTTMGPGLLVDHSTF